MNRLHGVVITAEKNQLGGEASYPFILGMNFRVLEGSICRIWRIN